LIILSCNTKLKCQKRKNNVHWKASRHSNSLYPIIHYTIGLKRDTQKASSFGHSLFSYFIRVICLETTKKEKKKKKKKKERKKERKSPWLRVWATQSTHIVQDSK
jgi:hypothetical protein